MKEALLDPAIPTQSLSGYWVNRNGKPILAYFGDSDSLENAHSVPVMSHSFVRYYGPYTKIESQLKMLAQNHYHTQLLFHHQLKPLGLSPDGRHATNRKTKAFVYYVEGDPTPHFRPKGLRHSIEVWGERGPHHDVSFICSSIFF